MSTGRPVDTADARTPRESHVQSLGVTQPRDIVDEVRALLEVVRIADLDALDAARRDEIVDSLATICDALDPHVVDEVRMQAGLRSSVVTGGVPGQLPDLTGVTPAEFFPYSPLIGPLNPIAPPFEFWHEGDELHGRGRFGSAYNGPPGSVHGGHVAALMDELLGATGVMTGNHGFTGTLSIRYEALTPLHTDLTLRAWVDRADGRKSHIRGELRHGETVCATAEGVFIRPKEHGDLREP